MRCEPCGKFASYDDSNEPEIQSEEIDPSGHISISARIYLTHDECGTELKEATFDLEDDLPEDVLELHQGEGHDLSLEVIDSEMTSRQDGKAKTPARYRRTYYGVCVRIEVTCSCGPEAIHNNDLTDDIQASAMDELC